MKEIQRENYVKKLVERKSDGLVKIITGVRRCGKSYLLFKLYKKHLIRSGVKEDHIITIDLENFNSIKLRNSEKLYQHVISHMSNKKEEYYIFIDEIQHVEGFVDLVNGLRHLPGADVYITGSNSKFLSSEIATEFRGRGEVIQIRPLSFSEFISVYEGSIQQAWDEYMRYGGMPEAVDFSPQHKQEYLYELIKSVYLVDIAERNKVRNPESLESLVSSLCSSVGSLTNISKTTNTMATLNDKKVDNKTVAKYIMMLQDSFLFEKSQRYDIKGRKYFDSICKYYVVDVGLRNAWLGYRQLEPTHIMENIIYNELRSRGYFVDVGIVPIRMTKENDNQYIQLKIDFVANRGNERIYIQSAYSIPDADKHNQEIRPFLNVRDSFRKIIIVDGDEMPWTDERGITTMGITRFLLDESLIE